MDWTDLLKIALTTIISTVIMTYLSNGRKRKISFQENGDQVLRLPKLYLVLGCFASIIALIFGIFTLIDQTADFIFIGIGVFLMFGSLGANCLFYYYNHQVRFNSHFVVVTNWKGKEIQFDWADIQEVDLHSMSGLYKLKIPAHRVSIHSHLTGLNYFLKKLEEKTYWTEIR